MAAFTSSQSGNFSASSTWGGAGVPGDGDTFTITNGHTVTIDTGISVPTNGYGDSNIYGVLQSQLNANTTLRMNGRLYINTNGLLHLRDGAKIQINGSSPEQHGIWQENQTGASVIMEGSDGMPSTTLTAAVTEGSTVLPVTSATNFAAGEWIAVFDNITPASNTNYYAEYSHDEGFWIHDVSGNNIYFRIFGGPNDVSVSNSSGSTITVTNAKVFREGQQIIFGTGSNRNIKTITGIDYGSNVITCDSAITGSVAGQIVYLTGTEKYHNNGTKVRKVATVTTAETASGGTTINVANANMFSAGDEIWVEWRSEADGSTDYVGYFSGIGNISKSKQVISSVSGNTITLSSGTPYTVVSGALITRMTRNIICETVATDGSDYAFFYAESLGNYTRTLILKDVYFKNFGNDDSNAFTGVHMRGWYNINHSSASLTQQIPTRDQEPWLESVIVENYPEQSHENDLGGLWLYARYAKARCCFVMNGDDGICCYYEAGCSVVNSIATASQTWLFRLEGCSENYEWAYLYGSRGVNILRYIPIYESGVGTHDLIGDAALYGAQVYSTNAGTSIFRSRFTGLRYGNYSDQSPTSMAYSYSKSLSGLPSPEKGDGTSQAGNVWTGSLGRTRGAAGFFSLEHNYEYDAMAIYSYYWEAHWDNNENAWRFFRRYDASGDPMMSERVFIPANTTVFVSADIKLADGFNGNYPYLIAEDLVSSYSTNAIGNSGGANTSQWAGNYQTALYSAAAASNYETKQITVDAKPYPRSYVFGIYSNSANAAEGFWIKNFRVNFDKPYAAPVLELENNQRQLVSFSGSYRSSFDEQKIRLGGRLA